MLTRRSFISLSLAAALTLSSASAFAKDFGKEAEGFIQSLADRAITAVRTIDDAPTLEKEFRTLLNDGFDVRAIGKWVLGRHWRKATSEEKEEYLNLFEDFIIVTYSNRFKDYAGDGITLKVTESISRENKDAVVRSQIQRPTAGEPLMVDWRVKAKKDGKLKIVDVVVAGVSMSQTQRSEFASVIKRNGNEVSGLIDALKNKTEQLVDKVEAAK